MVIRNESTYQANLIKKLKTLFPGCFIIKNDPAEHQGIPDLLVLFGTHWCALECKVSSRSNIQANQAYYIDMFNNMSFASFISPDTEEDVLNDLEHSFGITW